MAFYYPQRKLQLTHWMSDTTIYTSEHSAEQLSSDELILLAKRALPKLVEKLDFQQSALCTGYFIGVDHLAAIDRPIFVGPKRDATRKLDYMSMLRTCLFHPGVHPHIEELFNIRFEKQPIRIRQQDDLLTPLLIVQFLRATELVVKKGLRKGYYKKTESMTGKIKGRILVSETIRRHHYRNDFLTTDCKYQEFGIDTPPNRILNKTLRFIQRYAQLMSASVLPLGEKLRFLTPAFDRVGTEVGFMDIENYRPSPFYAEYTEAIALARLLLKRFGYQLNAVRSDAYTDVPPFWIDMSKLFELYALSKLQDDLAPGELVFQADGEFGFLDFLRTSQGDEMIIDAKYKYIYDGNGYDINDVRQLSAYARDRGLLKQLQIPEPLWKQTVLPCLIIYPDTTFGLVGLNPLPGESIKQFERFFRVGIRLPMINLD
jgi:5-methylcytosine-specific restriction enzyme subunit McrC